ncbi:dentin sialophosphoprotein [Hyalella azteca]|uniref:Dentin sialophosphoprotein n=1 Tax=Hyalella azteca TaxID=294128 RepID=A0A8B7NX58_HYAAZ|nr:dentin sialophosphoprotein [Hyalella azteca]
MPTPMPSPLPTPSKQRQTQLRTNSTESSNMENTADETESEASVTIERTSSGASISDSRIFFQAFGENNKEKHKNCLPLIVPKLILNLPSPGTSPAGSPASSPKVKTRPPPLILSDSNFIDMPNLVPVINVHNENGEMLERFDSTPRQRSQSLDVGSVMKIPSITITMASESPTITRKNSTNHSFQPPVFTITSASPKLDRRNSNPFGTLENMESSSGPIVNTVHVPFVTTKKRGLRDGQNYLGYQDFPSIGTPSSILDSDPESPNRRLTGPSPNLLSPFFGAAGSHMTSESNLSSSGYSSAYSPGPSRCNSNNPLFSTETDDSMTHSLSSIPSCPMASLAGDQNTRTGSTATTSPSQSNTPTKMPAIILPSIIVESTLGMTDSETTDEPQTSQPDSALDVDTNDEPESDGPSESHSVKERTNLGTDMSVRRQINILISSHSFPGEAPRLHTCPPTIVVHGSLQNESSLEDYMTDNALKPSPVSSRSESPTSDSRLTVNQIRTSFFNKSGRRELPHTDSDGLYDFPSTEALNFNCHRSQPNLKRPGHRKTRKSSNKSRARHQIRQSENDNNCFGSNRDAIVSLEPPSQRRSRILGPKRRARARRSIDLLSSSDESIPSPSVDAHHCLQQKAGEESTSSQITLYAHCDLETTSDSTKILAKSLTPERGIVSSNSDSTIIEQTVSYRIESYEDGENSIANTHLTVAAVASGSRAETLNPYSKCSDPSTHESNTSFKVKNRKTLTRSDGVATSTLTRQNSVDTSEDETQEDRSSCDTSKKELDPQHRKSFKLRAPKNEMRLFRRFSSTSLNSPRRQVAPSGASNSDPDSEFTLAAADPDHRIEFVSRPRSN